MFKSCVQTVLHLQPDMLEVSFSTAQLLYQLRADPVYTTPQLGDVIDVSSNSCKAVNVMSLFSKITVKLRI